MPNYLARHHVDPAGLGEARLAAGVRAISRFFVRSAPLRPKTLRYCVLRAFGNALAASMMRHTRSVACWFDLRPHALRAEVCRNNGDPVARVRGAAADRRFEAPLLSSASCSPGRC